MSCELVYAVHLKTLLSLFFILANIFSHLYLQNLSQKVIMVALSSCKRSPILHNNIIPSFHCDSFSIVLQLLKSAFTILPSSPLKNTHRLLIAKYWLSIDC